MLKQNQLYLVKPLPRTMGYSLLGLAWIYFDFEEKYVCFFNRSITIFRSSHVGFDWWYQDLTNRNNPRYAYQEVSIGVLLTHKNSSYREWAREKLKDIEKCLGK